MRKNTDYNVKFSSWFSPIEVINHFEKLRQRYGKLVMKADFKRAREMFSSAVVLLGAYELSSENKYWLQSNTQSTSPDVMAAKQTETENGIDLELAQIEVTDFEEHFKSDDIVEFLQKTKLKKGTYDDHTIICVMINKSVAINIAEVQERLTKVNPEPVIYFLGRSNNSEFGNFTIVTAFPPVLGKGIPFNVNETANKYKLPPRVELSRSMSKKIKFEKVKMKPINTYDVLGLNQKLIDAKYHKK